ncbi:MAG: dephospho-CoA kinase [Anaerolineae bacterium]
MRSDASADIPYRIGLTGNIATGKTTVGHMLVELGAELIDADRVAHAVMAPEGAAYEPVVEAFGSDILAQDGTIDRGKLGRRVFSDPAALRRLEALVHPPVIAAVERRIACSSAPVVVVEAIKLLESGMAASYEAIWVTTCSSATQLERLVKGRGMDSDAALQRIRAQPPQEEKLAQADVVIDTEGTLDETRAQVRTAWCEIRQEAAGDCEDDG